MRALRVTSAVMALSLFAACGGSDETPRDITLQPAAAADSQAVLRDVAATPPAGDAKQPATTPTKSTTPPPKAPAPKATTTSSVAYGTIAAGTEIGIRPEIKVCTNTHKVGDRISGTVAEAVTGTNGATIPAGSAATVEVVASQYGKNDANKVALTFKVVSVAFGGNTYELAPAEVTAPVTRVRRQSNTEQAKKVAAGAAIGAIVGQIAGKDTKSTVIGAAVGAAGGGAVAAATTDYDGCVAPDARLAVKLSEALRVRA